MNPEDMTFEQKQIEIIKKTDKIIETLKTEGWEIIEKIFKEQIDSLYKKLRNCKEDELQRIQGTLIAFETILNTLNFVKQENKVAKEQLEDLREGGE